MWPNPVPLLAKHGTWSTKPAMGLIHNPQPRSLPLQLLSPAERGQCLLRIRKASTYTVKGYEYFPFHILYNRKTAHRKAPPSLKTALEDRSLKSYSSMGKIMPANLNSVFMFLSKISPRASEQTVKFALDNYIIKSGLANQSC